VHLHGETFRHLTEQVEEVQSVRLVQKQRPTLRAARL
jgi:hypothetical protein